MEKTNNNQLPIINHQFSQVHASFWNSAGF